MQDYLNSSYDELVARAKYLLPDVFDQLCRLDKDGNGIPFLFSLLGVGIVADGQLSDLEYLFLCDTVNNDFTFAEMKSLLQKYCEEDYSEVIYRILKSLDDDARCKLAHFVICFMAVDERIAPEENAYIQYLFSEL